MQLWSGDMTAAMEEQKEELSPSLLHDAPFEDDIVDSRMEPVSEMVSVKLE